MVTAFSGIFTRSLASDAPLAHPLGDPLQDEIRDLQMVLVLHDHVAVAPDAALRRVEHLRLTARALDATDEGLAILETLLRFTPKRKLGHTPSSLNLSQTGWFPGGVDPARTLLKTAWLKPERPRPTWSGTYTG